MHHKLRHHRVIQLQTNTICNVTYSLSYIYFTCDVKNVIPYFLIICCHLSVLSSLSKLYLPRVSSMQKKNHEQSLFFTALHEMQTRYCDENSVCLSVCLSVTRVYCDKTVERSVQIYIPYEKTFILVFWEEEWLVGGDPFYVKFWVNRPPLERNRRFSTNNRS